MSLEPALLAEDVEAAFRSIRARVVEVFDQEPEARQLKLDGSVVTALDLELEAILAEALLALEPSFGLVGEEGGTLREGSPTWVLDPLDGTANFSRRSPLFGSQVALLDGTRPLFSAVYEPLRDDFTWAAEGAGAWREGRRLHVSARPVDEAIVNVDLADTGIFVDDPDLITRLRHLCFKVRSFGTIALQLRDVAAGTSDGYLGGRGYPTALYDLAPGVLLVREAGGTVSDGAGGDPFDERTTLIAATDAVHAAVATLLQEPRS